MFQNLRVGTPLYVLHKKEPLINIGEVISVSSPQPKYDTTYRSGSWTPPKNFVDVQIKVNGQTIDLQQLPADVTIADFGNNGIVVSESRDAIINEIEVLRKNSSSALEDIDRHKHVVEECDIMIATLNPQIKQDAKREEELKIMRGEMKSMQEGMDEIKDMLARVLNTSSVQKKEK